MVSLLFSILFVAILNTVNTNASPLSKLSSRAEEIPQFVKDFAPVVFLDKEEKFFPSDIAKHIENTAPFITLNAVDPPPAVTVDNLETLNTLGNQGDDIFLTSKELVKDNPAFLAGTKPDDTGATVGATSCVTIVSDHGDGTVDAFYMYFFSYNQGTTILFHELGDHVGDWEHNMIRFKNGVPEAVWFSQHAGGQAFAYSGLEKEGDRPVVYTARGTHAIYSKDGDHDHTIPGINFSKGPLEDYTSRGTRWDPMKSTFFYTFDRSTETLTSVDNSPLGIVQFKGKWGDARYPKGKKGQEKLFSFRKYVDGPNGPQTKNLNRANVCPDKIKDCDIKTKVAP
ncbi:putative vacuolar protein sorting-associated protein TDA6 [Golovinomyces cichoracearum]|uniref:Putative vacuolar protein sorting-associated protein TDA6 n=1 Tax=Golovinomyces cichoracearum TaxID=62708 RepID=A0A420HGA3_9PEZI|nr:putative vacuolar protein sorting-associated protein TDA6 [Golovinomyces cichoracearum]